MSTINKEQIEEILHKHAEWTQDCNKGTRANLSRAILSGADLSRAILYGADLSGAWLSRAILSGADLSRADLSRADLSGTIYEGKSKQEFQFEKHKATYFGIDEIKIGCKALPIQDWVYYFEQLGKEAGYSDKQIEKYGAFIKNCAEDFARSKK